VLQRPGSSRMHQGAAGPVDVSMLWGGGSAASLPHSTSEAEAEADAALQMYRASLQRQREGECWGPPAAGPGLPGLACASAP
jgi:hypothetical protein